MIDPSKITAGQPLYHVYIDEKTLRPLLHPCVEAVTFAQAEDVSPTLCHIVSRRGPHFAKCEDLFTHWEPAARTAVERLGTAP